MPVAIADGVALLVQVLARWGPASRIAPSLHAPGPGPQRGFLMVASSLFRFVRPSPLTAFVRGRRYLPLYVRSLWVKAHSAPLRVIHSRARSD